MLSHHYHLLKYNIEQILKSSLCDKSALGAQYDELYQLFKKAEKLSLIDQSHLSSNYLLETMLHKLKKIDIEVGLIVDKNPEIMEAIRLLIEIEALAKAPYYVQSKTEFTKNLIDSINHYSSNGSGLIGEITDNTAMNIRAMSFEDLKNLKVYPLLDCYKSSGEALKYRKSIIVGRSRDDLVSEVLDPNVPNSIMFAATVGKKEVVPYFILKGDGNIILYQDKSKDQNSTFLQLIRTKSEHLVKEHGVAHIDIELLSNNALTWVSLMFTLILETYVRAELKPVYFIGDLLLQNQSNAVVKFKHLSEHAKLPQIKRDEILMFQPNLDSETFNLQNSFELWNIELEFAPLVDDECLNLIGLDTDKFYYNVNQKAVEKNPKLDLSAEYLGDRSNFIPLLSMYLNDYADLETVRKTQKKVARANFASILNHYAGQASQTQYKAFKVWLNNILNIEGQTQIFETLKKLLPSFQIKGDEISKLNSDLPLLQMCEIKAFKNQGVDNHVFSTLNFVMKYKGAFSNYKKCVLTDKTPTHALVVKFSSFNDIKHFLGDDLPAAPDYMDFVSYYPELQKIVSEHANQLWFIKPFTLFQQPVSITIPLTKSGIKTLLAD